jgi:hypothetical protein
VYNASIPCQPFGPIPRFIIREKNTSNENVLMS